MLGVVLGLVLATNIEPSEGLQVTVFDEYARRLAGPEFKVEMSAEVARRPLVWYLGKPGDGVADLKRSCELLDLGCEVDGERQTIFIYGPLAIAGPSLRERYEKSLAKPYELVRKIMGMDLLTLDRRVQQLEGIRKPGRLEYEEQMELELCYSLAPLEGRVVGSYILSKTVGEWAETFEKLYMRDESFPVAGDAASLLEQLKTRGSTSRFAPENYRKRGVGKNETTLDLDNSDRARFMKAVAERGDFRFQVHGGVPGHAGVYLSVIDDSDKIDLGGVALKDYPMVRPGSSAVPEYELRAYLEPFMQNEGSSFFHTYFPINLFGDFAVRSGGNFVSWLGVGVHDLQDNWYGSLDMLQFNRSDDGWWHLYSVTNRYPTYLGDWRKFLEFYSLWNKRNENFADFRRWLMRTSTNDLWQIFYAGAQFMRVGDIFGEWVFGMPIFRAAFFEMDATGKREGFRTRFADLTPIAGEAVKDGLEWPSYRGMTPSLFRPNRRAKWDDFELVCVVDDSHILVGIKTGDEDHFSLNMPVTREGK